MAASPTRDAPRAPAVPELSVVVLCYRSGELAREFAGQLVRELEEADIDFELVLVANYFPAKADPTPEIVRSIAESDPRIRALALEKHGMMGWDMRTGLEITRGAHVAVIDGDGQMPASDVVKTYRVLQVGQYDLVKTFRAQRFDGWYRWSISKVYNFLFHIFFPGSAMFRDINSKPKVLTRRAYESLNLLSNGWFTDAEIMIEAIHNGLKVGEVSTIFLENERRASFVPPSAIFEFLWNLLYYRFVRFRMGEDRFADRQES